MGWLHTSGNVCFFNTSNNKQLKLIRTYFKVINMVSVGFQIRWDCLGITDFRGHHTCSLGLQNISANHKVYIVMHVRT